MPLRKTMISFVITILICLHKSYSFISFKRGTRNTLENILHPKNDNSLLSSSYSFSNSKTILYSTLFRSKETAKKENKQISENENNIKEAVTSSSKIEFTKRRKKYQNQISYPNRNSLKNIIQTIEKEFYYTSDNSREKQQLHANELLLLQTLWNIQKSQSHYERDQLLYPTLSYLLEFLKTSSSIVIKERLVKFLSKIDCFEIAYELHDTILNKCHIMPSIQSYQELLNSFHRCSEVEALNKVFWELICFSNSQEKEKVTLNAFHIFLKSQCNAGNYQEMVDLILSNHENSTKLMRNLQEPFSMQTFNILLHELSRHSDQDELFDKVYNFISVEQQNITETQTSYLKANVYTFNTLIRRNGNNYIKIHSIINEMKLNQIKLDSYTLDLILVPFIYNGKMEEFCTLLHHYLLSTHDQNRIQSALESFLVRFMDTDNSSSHTISTSSSHSSSFSTSTTTVKTELEQAEQKHQVQSKILECNMHHAHKIYHYIISNSKIQPTIRHYNLLLEGYRRLANHYFITKTKNQECDEILQVYTEKLSKIRADVKTLYYVNITQPDSYTCSSFVDIMALTSVHTHDLKNNEDEKECSRLNQDSKQEIKELNQYIESILSSSSSIKMNRIVLHTIIKAYGIILRQPQLSLYVFDYFLSEGKSLSSLYLSTACYNTLFWVLSQEENANYKFDFSHYNDISEDSLLLRLREEDNDEHEHGSLLSSVQNKAGWETSLYLLDSILNKSACEEHQNIVLAKKSRLNLKPNLQTFCMVATSISNAQNISRLDSIYHAKYLFNASQQILKDQFFLDGRFLNALLRCFQDDIESAILFWKYPIGSYIRRCNSSINKKDGAATTSVTTTTTTTTTTSPTPALYLIQAYHGLLHVCGQSLRPDLACRIVYAMKKEGIEITDLCLKCYEAGKAIRQSRIALQKKKDNGGSNMQRIEYLQKQQTESKMKKKSFMAVKWYEDILEVECRKFNMHDVRFQGDKRIRIIL